MKDLKVGQRVKKWFDSDKKVFNGTVQDINVCSEHGPSCGNKFAKILWDDGLVDDELVQDLEPL